MLFSACLSACTKSNDVVAKINAQQVIDSKIISAYLKNNSINASEIDSAGVFPTGIYYKKIDSAGTGNDLYTSATQVTIGYTGWLLTAKSTLGPVIAQTNQFHPSFVLGSVIRGWQWGIPEIKQGGAITLFLPSRYAYGPFPQPDLGLPANAVLVFHIMLYNVTN